MKQNKVVKMADHEATRDNRRKRDSRAILDACQKLAVEHLVRAFPAMMDKVDDALFDRVNQSENAADHSVYFDTMRDMRLKRSDINAEFKAQGDLASLFDDDVHPNDAGYEVIATAWFNAITQSRASAAASGFGRFGFTYGD